jgi:glucose-6-phosphate 1-epimerase
MGIDTLQARWGRHGEVEFDAEDGVPVVVVTHPAATARIALKGAQVMSYVPTGAELLWVSPSARLAGPQAMRGGIPVCWPWFAAHPVDTGKPMHGFARTSPWEVTGIGGTDGSSPVTVEMALSTGPEHAPLWPHQARLQLTVEIGATLALKLATSNTGAEPFQLTQALHTYFRVGDVSRATVHGLDGIVYLDKVESFARKRQAGPVTIDREVDRIYVGTTGGVTIEDLSLARRIAITKKGSASTVVWNPGAERGAQMSDVGAEAWRHFLCVETTNAGDDVTRVEPGTRHELAVTYAVERSVSER